MLGWQAWVPDKNKTSVLNYEWTHHDKVCCKGCRPFPWFPSLTCMHPCCGTNPCIVMLFLWMDATDGIKIPSQLWSKGTSYKWQLVASSHIMLVLQEVAALVYCSQATLCKRFKPDSQLWHKLFCFCAISIACIFIYNIACKLDLSTAQHSGLHRLNQLILGGDHLIEDCHCWACCRCNASFRWDAMPGRVADAMPAC